jgi:hypothetical protein
MRQRAARPREAGETLIELMLSVALIGIAVVTIVAGLTVAITASDHHRKHSTAETLLRRSAEQIKSRDTLYIKRAGCGGAGQYALPTPPAGYSITITEVAFWNGANPAGFSTTCPASDAVDPRVQRITLMAQGTDGRGPETIQILKTPRDTNEVP